METTASKKSIRYDRITKDFAYSYDGQLLGYAASYLEAETKLNDYVYELLSRDSTAEIADLTPDDAEVMPDHVHLFISASPTIAPVTLAKTLKSIVAVETFRAFPLLKQRHFWGSGLWPEGCYYGSAGMVSTKTIAMYIANQKDA